MLVPLVQVELWIVLLTMTSKFPMGGHGSRESFSCSALSYLFCRSANGVEEELFSRRLLGLSYLLCPGGRSTSPKEAESLAVSPPWRHGCTQQRRKNQLRRAAWVILVRRCLELGTSV